MDLETILAQLNELDTLDNDALEALRGQLAEAAESFADQDTAEAVDALEKIADALDKVTQRQGALAQEAADRKARAQAALDKIKGATSTEPDPAAGDAPEAPAAEAKELEPVAAAGTPVITRVAPVAAKRPAATAAKPQEPAKWGLTASGNVDGFQAGEALDDPGKIARAFASMFEATRGWNKGRTQLRVASTLAQFPAERTLGRDTRVNGERIKAVTSLEALTASGGVCAPTPVQYDLPVIGSDARPVRDNMLARFGADRGGVTLLPPPQLSDITDDVAVATWTEANDQNPSSPATKPCLTVTCPTEEETLVDAITRCLKFGNYRARYFPEQVEAWMTLAAVRHARHAATKLLTAIGSGSTQVTTGQLLGSSRDVLASVERVAVRFRNYHRLPRTAPLRFAAPEWLLANMRTDLLRELPGSTEERMAVADATIEGWLRARAINPSWFLDGESGQVFGAQPDGHALAWPSTVVTYLYAEGSWLFLDGGQLDLGIVRDSSLNAVNNFQMFMETFENVAFHGVESFRLTMDICPSGWTSGTVDITPCTTGS